MNDLWAMGIHRYNPDGTIFPLIATNYGFAKSYNIKQSFLIGAGAGRNIRNNSLPNYL
ncbi:MAG: hypothetical protein V3U54_02860 [Thermodesulfobacteriota bacterium]